MLLVIYPIRPYTLHHNYNTNWHNWHGKGWNIPWSHCSLCRCWVTHVHCVLFMFSLLSTHFGLGFWIVLSDIKCNMSDRIVWDLWLFTYLSVLITYFIFKRKWICLWNTCTHSYHCTQIWNSKSSSEISTNVVWHSKWKKINNCVLKIDSIFLNTIIARNDQNKENLLLGAVGSFYSIF